MADKVYKTRLALKIDRVDRWEKSTTPLYEGEVAISYELAEDKITKKGFRFKIGHADNKGNLQTWSQLDFVKINEISDDMLEYIKEHINIKELQDAITVLQNEIIRLETTLDGMTLAEVNGCILKLTEKIELKKK